eukprot:Lankesteria_metandrocarpae@DN3067_c0_g1_i1.p1
MACHRLFPPLLDALPDYLTAAAIADDGRMACATSSATILVFSANTWILEAALEQAHVSLISRLDWSAPFYGETLLSSALDGSISVWRESKRQSRLLRRRQRLTAGSREDDDSLATADILSLWTNTATFNDCMSAVVDTRLCPPDMGFRFAACCEDGKVYVYSCDEPACGDCWYMEVLTSSSEHGCTSLAWCPGLSTPATLNDCEDSPTTELSVKLLVGHMDGCVNIWRRDLASWNLLFCVMANSHWVNGLSVSASPWSTFGTAYVALVGLCHNEGVTILGMHLDDRQSPDELFAIPLDAGVRSAL